MRNWFRGNFSLIQGPWNHVNIQIGECFSSYFFNILLSMAKMEALSALSENVDCWGQKIEL